MNEISTEMLDVEKYFNNTNVYFHRLNEALLNQNDRNLKNLSKIKSA